MNLLVAEFRKLSSVRTTWIVSLIGWAVTGLGTAFFVLEERMTGPFEGTDGEIAAAVGQVGANSIIVLVIAILVMTTEFRHGTIGRTLQLTPSRTRVLLGKLAVGVVYGLLFFVVGLVVVAGVLGLGMAVRGFSPEVGTVTIEALWQGPAGLALTALLGVAVGSLLRSQVVAITLSLVWVFVVEQLVVAFWPEVGRWLPFTALNAVFTSQELTVEGAPAFGDMLEPGIGLTVFLGYVAVAAVLSAILMRVRDV